jgi:hypothetical protein
MNKAGKIKSIKKVLSPNDIGLTGGHQAGILVPKKEEILSFFPKLDGSEKNPRYLLTFYDDCDVRWDFSFIYYNNALFGGTRNEYRLTRMTKFIKSNNLKVGDEVILTHENDGSKRISYERNEKQIGATLKLSGEWKVIILQTK